MIREVDSCDERLCREFDEVRMKLAIPAMCCFLIVCGLLLIPDGDLAGVGVYLVLFFFDVYLLAQIFKNRRRVRILALILLILFSGLLYAMFRHYNDVRGTVRWMVEGFAYKREVLNQHVSQGLRHAEWDGWGMAGQDTDVYLVYDPSDSLANAARSGSPGKYSGLPCEVYRVHRLESHWYTVHFYTNTTWDFCE